MKRRDVLKTLAGGAALLASGGPAAAVSPNIILLVTDDMTFEEMQRMPQLAKRLGLAGVTFLRCLTATPECGPARATLLTGQFAHNHGLVENSVSYTNLDLSTCMPRRLQLAGYKTCHIGKYINSYTPTDNGGVPLTGYDEWHTTTSGSIFYYSYSINDNGVVTVANGSEASYHTTVLTNRAVSFINSATQPFFMQVAYFAPHFTNNASDFYTAEPELAYKNTQPGSRTAPRDPNFNQQIANPPAYMSLSAIDTPTTNLIDSFYRGQNEMLFSVDRSIQTIMDTLISSGKTNTYVIFTSDNGFMEGQHRDPNGKNVPYTPSVKVPLVITGPGVSAAKISNALVSHVDIPATIYALTGATSSRALDGASLVPLLSNPNGSVRSVLLTEFASTLNIPPLIPVPQWAAIQNDKYYYAEYPASGNQELYDLLADPWNQTNQAGNAGFTSVRTQLAAQLATLRTCSGASCVIT